MHSAVIYIHILSHMSAYIVLSFQAQIRNAVLPYIYT